MYTLLLDDVRNEVWIDITVRSAEALLSSDILFTTPISALYLDHDLGQDSEGNDKMSGYQFLQYCLENLIPLPPKVVLVSANPIGREKMGKCLEHDFNYAIDYMQSKRWPVYIFQGERV